MDLTDVELRLQKLVQDVRQSLNTFTDDVLGDNTFDLKEEMHKFINDQVVLPVEGLLSNLRTTTDYEPATPTAVNRNSIAPSDVPHVHTHSDHDNTTDSGDDQNGIEGQEVLETRCVALKAKPTHRNVAPDATTMLLGPAGGSARDLLQLRPVDKLTERAKPANTQEKRGPTFSCSYVDVSLPGKENLESICRDPEAKEYGYAKLIFGDLPLLEFSGRKIQEPKVSCVSQYETKKTGDIFVKTVRKEGKYSLPSLPLETPPGVSLEELRTRTDDILRSPPRGHVPYIIGTPEFTDLQLHPGPLLETRNGGQPIEGINTPFVYWNISGKPTITPFHQEDFNLCSINIVRSGALKVMVTIRPSSTAAFVERLMEDFNRTGPPRRCSQCIRHLSRATTLSQLETWGIDFTLDAFGPGEGFLTLPNTYHMVVNLGDNYALAINYESETGTKPTSSCGARCPDGPHLSLAAYMSPREEHLFTDEPVLSHSSSPSLPDLSATLVQPPRISSSVRHSSAASVISMPRSELTSGPSTDSSSTSLAASPVGPTPRSPPQMYSQHGAVDPATNRRPLKRKSSLSRLSKRHRQESLSVTNDVVSHILRADRLCNVPTFDPANVPDPQVLRLAAAVRSRPMVKQFCDLVNLRRELQPYHDVTPSPNPHLSAARRLRLLERLHSSTMFVRLNQYLFAGELEMARIKNGRTRLDSEVKRAVLQDSGLSEAQYKSHSRAGNAWRKICGEFDGLLCFIPLRAEDPLGIPPGEYHNLNDHQLQAFHCLLRDPYTSTLCKAGRAFQDSFGADDVQFRWEGKRLKKPLHELPEEDMLLLMRPMVFRENEYCGADFPDWQDPTLLSPSQQCEICDSQSPCSCHISQHATTRLRIKSFPGKGLGLQAVSDVLGSVVYHEHELLGFLTGKLVPPNTFCDDRTVDFHRSQISCHDEGNMFRLMNHACAGHAVARLQKMKVSGRYRMGVRATTPIYNGAEITIDYQTESSHKCQTCEDLERQKNDTTTVQMHTVSARTSKSGRVTRSGRNHDNMGSSY